MNQTRPSYPSIQILKKAFAAPVVYAGAIINRCITPLILFLLAIALFVAFTGTLAGPGEVPRSIGVGLLILLVGGIASYVLFAVTLHRIFLIGADAVPKFGLRKWTYRETRFLGWGIVFFLFSLIIVFGMGLLASMMFMGSGTEAGADFSNLIIKLIVVNLAIAIPIAWVFSRICPLFPATATGKATSLDWALDLTRNYQWSLFLIVGLTPQIINMVASWLIALLPDVIADILSLLLVIYLTVFTVAVLSYSYDFLAGAQPDLAPEDADASADANNDSGQQ